MKKNLLKLITTLAFFASTNAIASNKIGMAFDQGFGVTVQFENINGFIGNDGLSGDYLINQGDFGEDVPVFWYVGAGGYYNWSGSDNIGARAPLGLTFPFAKRWDIYGQISPQLDYNIDHSKLKFGIGAALGIRYSF